MPQKAYEIHPATEHLIYLHIRTSQENSFDKTFTLYKFTVEQQNITMSEGYLKRNSGFFTKAIHGGFEPEQESSWPLVPSIAVSSTFEQEGPGQDRNFIYTRVRNPTRLVLEKCLAEIDNAKYGLCFTSGLGATTAIISLLSAGDHIIAGDELYGGTTRLFKEIFGRMNIQFSFVDTRDPEKIENAIKANTKLVWLETPTNPLLKIIDIATVAKIVHKHKDIILVVDNTFLTPYFQQPLNLGADISMHSMSKYMNGHIDIVMGSIATNNENLYERLRFLQHAMGISPSPFDCYQVNRSLKTLPLRMEQHMKSGLAVAKYLEKQPEVERVIHPGLPSHPQHSFVKKQCYGMSGMLSFYIKDGLTCAKSFIKSLKMIKYAGSLGGYTTTLQIPCLMTHKSMPVELRELYGVTDNLIRLSVGLESVDDIIGDLSQAFESLHT